MADVPKVPGPTPQQPSRGPREPAKPGTDKFKELMKVGEPEEQQKKRPQQKEEEKEEKKAKAQPKEEGMKTPPLPKEPERTKEPEKLPHVKAGEPPQKKEFKPKKLPEKVPEPEEEEEEEAPPPAGEKEEQVEEQPPPPLFIPEKKVQPEKGPPEKKVAGPKHEKKIEKPTKEAEAPLTAGLGPLFIPPATESAPAYTLLKPEALALFEKMVSQIVVMHTSGITETTFTLDTPEFASSPFAGARVIIREYSTAPLVYNIEFEGSSQNIGTFAQNIGSLRAAFDSEKRNFAINRIDTRLLERGSERSRPVERKEKPSDKGEEGF